MEQILGFAARVESLARRPGAWVVIGLVLALHCANVSSRRMGDFTLYHRAASRLVAGEEIYPLADRHRYLYGPALTFLFVPLAMLPLGLAKVAWYAINVAVTVSAFRLVAELVFDGQRAPPGFFVLLFLASLRFIDNNLGHGQINLLLFWWIVAAYALASRRRFTLAGLALGAAIVTKVFPAILLAGLAVRREWRFAGAATAAVALLLVAPVLWWGSGYPDVVAQWLAALRDQVGHYEMGNKANQSIAAFAYRLFRPHPLGEPVVVLPPLAVAAVAWSIHALFWSALVWTTRRADAEEKRRPHGPGARDLSLYLLYATVATPYSWKYYFVDLILPLGVALRGLWSPERRRAAAVVVLVVVLNLLPGFRLFGKPSALLFQLYSFHFLSAVALFAAIASERPRLHNSES